MNICSGHKAGPFSWQQQGHVQTITSLVSACLQNEQIPVYNSFASLAKDPVNAETSGHTGVLLSVVH